MNNIDVEKLIGKKIVLIYLPEYEDVEHKYNFGNVDYINEDEKGNKYIVLDNKYVVYFYEIDFIQEIDEKIFDILKMSIRRRGTYWVKKIR